MTERTNGYARVLFIGSKRIGLQSLEAIHRLAPERLCGVITCDDSADARTELYAFERFCADNRVPFNVAKGRAQSEELLQSYQADLCIVVGWYWLIGDSTIKSVPGGFFGVHNSLLPLYRGSSPLVWAIINGDQTVGFSLFRLTTGFDDGDVYYQFRHSLQPSDDVGTVLQAFEAAVVVAWQTTYMKILAGTACGVPQNHLEATFCAARRPDDGRINWCSDAGTIHKFVRAQTMPYPGAYTHKVGSDERLVVWKARPFERTYFGIPGQIALVNDAGIIVTCGSGTAILIEELAVSGTQMPAGRPVLGLGQRFQ